MSGSTSSADVIVFNEIPYTKLTPGTYVEARPSYTNIGALPYPTRVLLVGQMLAGGVAVANRPYPLLTPQQATALFGAGSNAEGLARFWLLQNPGVPVDIVGMADASGGTAASGTVLYTSVPAAGGMEYITVAGTRFAIPITTTDTVVTLASKVVAAVNAASPALPVSAANGGGSPVATVTFTALNKGTAGNFIDIRRNFLATDTQPAPNAVAAATITAMSGGATNPDITTLFAAIGAVWYTDFVNAWSDSTVLSAYDTELARRYNALVRLDAHLWCAWSGSYSALASNAAGRNSQFASIIAIRNPLEPHWAWAAAVAGKCIPRLTNDPSRQLRDLVLTGITAPAQVDVWIDSERELLLGLGLSTFRVEADGTVITERIVTTNKTTADGIATGAWRDVMRPKTVSRVRYDWAAYFDLVWGQSKLTDDSGLAAEHDDTVCTPSRARGSWAGRCNLYGKHGWIENIPAMVAASVFVRDGTDPNRLNARQPIQIVGNMMVLAAALEFQA